MEKRVILAVLLASALIIAVSFFLPGPPPADQEYLPWQISSTDTGSTRVFGLTLDQTTLQEAEQRFQGGMEVSLFVSPDGVHKVEAYFDKVVLGGFSARLILGADLTLSQMQAMFNRGSRVSSLGDGSQRVSLSSEDLPTVLAAPISSIAYLTRARLDEELLRSRFGQPARRLQEAESGTVHWLYPNLGLDIAIDQHGNSVLQYVSPGEFSRLLDPLQNSTH